MDAAAETWALIRDSQNSDDFDEFAKAFPGSELAAGARIRAAQLRRTPPVNPLIAERVEPPHRIPLHVTNQLWPVASDLDAVCRKEFGATAVLADWSDVVDAVVSNGMAMVQATLNLAHGAGATLTFNRQRTYAGSRYYFIQRLDGNKPGDYLAHAELGGNVLVVGSWYDPNNRILCKDR